MSATSRADVALATEQAEARPQGRQIAPQPWKKRVRKWALRGLLALVGVALLHAIAINVLLRTHLLRDLLSSDPMMMVVDYESAWSLVPGRAHAKMLSIRGRDRNVEWILKIDEVDFSVSVNELLRRRFHATRVRGEGVSFIVRQRVPAADLTPTKMAALPRIAGFDDAPIADPVKPPPLTDEEYNLWRVHLEDVIADPVREVWVDEGRFVGNARITGGFFLQPIRWAEVGPAKVVVREGDARTGSDVIARNLRGDGDCTIHGFDPRYVSGDDVLARVAAAVKLDGTIPSLAFVHDVTDFHATGGAGPAHVDVAVDGGLLERADIDVTSEGARVTLGEHTVHGSARTRVRTLGGNAERAPAARTAIDEGVEVDVGATPIALFRADAKGALVEAPRLRVIVRSPDRELSRLFARTAIGFDLPEADIPDAGRFDAYLAKDGAVHIEAGRGTLRAHGDIEGASAKGEASLHVVGTQARIDDKRVRADVTLIASATQNGPEIDLGGTRFEIAKAQTSGTDGAAPWDAKGQLTTGRISIARKAFKGHVAATCADARPIFETLAASTPIPRWAADLVALKGLAANADVDVSPPAFAIRNLRAKVQDRFEVAADVMHRDTTRSLLLVTSGPLALGIESNGGDTHIVPFGAPEWFSRAEATFR